MLKNIDFLRNGKVAVKHPCRYCGKILPKKLMTKHIMENHTEVQGPEVVLTGEQHFLRDRMIRDRYFESIGFKNNDSGSSFEM